MKVFQLLLQTNPASEHAVLSTRDGCNLRGQKTLGTARKQRASSRVRSGHNRIGCGDNIFLNITYLWRQQVSSDITF